METTTAHRVAAALLALGLLTSCGDSGADTEPASDASPAATDAGGSPAYGIGGDDDTAEGTTADDAAADQTTAEGGDDAAEAAAVTMTITGYAFEVPDSVAPGAEITVTNEDGVGHTVTSDDDGATFDVAVGPGETVTFTAPEEAGGFGFHCRPHPAMTATLVVEG